MAETPIVAIHVSSDSFAVAGDRSAEFVAGVRVWADCGADGVRYGTVVTAVYSSVTGVTTVILTPDAAGLTAGLTGVLHGNDVPASLCHHGHTGPADGGVLDLAAVGAATAQALADEVAARTAEDGTLGDSLAALAAQKGAASGLASLDGSSLVVQNPANATATPAAGKIALADAGGKLDAWVTDAATGAKGKVQLATPAEAQAGAEATKAVTPAALATAAKGLVTANTTISVATTGSDTTGDGSATKPFASIKQALASIAGKLIASGELVTIQVADGAYTVSSPIVLDHPDGDKIQINGNISAETTVAMAAIDTTAKTITVVGNYSAALASGDHVELIGSSTSGLNGVYAISGVSYDGTNTVITCSAETFASATVGGGSIVIKPCNKVILNCATNCFYVRTRVAAVRGFKMVGSGGTTGAAISVTNASFSLFTAQNIIVSFAFGAYAELKSHILLGSCAIKTVLYGVYALSGSSITSYSSSRWNIDGASTVGVMASAMAFATFRTSLIVFRNTTTQYSPALGVVGNNNSLVAGI